MTATAPGPDASWRDVRLGAAVVAVLALVIFALWIQRGRNPFVEAYVLNLYVPNAQGLQEGAPVLLSGVRVGEVERIDVLDASDRRRLQEALGEEPPNIRVVLGIDERYRTVLTSRSRARIGTQGVSGFRYIRVEKGAVGGRVLQSGERLPTLPSVDPELILARGSELVRAVERLNRDAAEVSAKIQAGGGSLGEFLADPDDNAVAEAFEEMNLRAARVLRSLDEGGGTIPLERRTRRIRGDLAALQASIGRIRESLRTGGGTLGLLASDTTLPAALTRFESRFARLERRIRTGEGSLGRFLNDPELYDQIERVTIQLDSLRAEMGDNPLGSIDIDLH